MEMPPSSTLQALWAKTVRDRTVAPDALTWHPLVAHMWDSAATAAWLWDHWLPQNVKDQLLGGDRFGRPLLRWLSALHDVGKASVVFQTKAPKLMPIVEGAGLRCGPVPKDAGEAPHGLVSGITLVDFLHARGWSEPEAEWLGLVIGGHHGEFPMVDWLSREQRPKEGLLGGPAWASARQQLIDEFTARLGVDLDAYRGVMLPMPAQLVLAGAVILADWLASTEELFPYVGDKLDDDYPDRLDRQAARAAEILGLRGAWRPDPLLADGRPDPEEFCGRRFNCTPRPVQRRAVEIAATVDRPGCLLIEAPTGEGKTEAALLGAEVLAARFGQQGIFIGLPTQATANQMFDRVTEWLSASGQLVTVALAHGKANRKKEYQELIHVRGVDVDAEAGPSDGSVVASEWFTRKKALLAPVVVATVDQLLLAGVAARHVALRHLGLAGKVVVVDEVHAYDAYMSTLLCRVLAWLGAMRVPVVLLSATLPSRQRQELLSAYAGRDVVDPELGYPRLVWVDAPDKAAPTAPKRRSFLSGERRPRPVPVSCRTTIERASSARTARVSMVAEPENAGVEPVAELVAELVHDGGCVLVLRNTVGRAQRTYVALRDRLPDGEVTLFHARFTVADRRRIEQRLVADFGKEGVRPFPRPRVVVATQVVEQSLDVDFDALVTDLAPIDLLIQRLGRTHRHPRAPEHRPPRLRTPAMYVVGHEPDAAGPPKLPDGSALVYEPYLVWRAAAVLAERPEIVIPDDVPGLVEAGYGDEPIGPSHWAAALHAARVELERKLERLQAEAEQIALGDPLRMAHITRLSQLTERSVGNALEEGDARVRAHVRCGPPTIEVLLLRDAGNGVATPVSGDGAVPLDRVPPRDTFDLLLDQAVRLPAQVTDTVAEAAFVPGAWEQTGWLARTPVLLLPSDGSPLTLGRHQLRYSTDLGLEVTRVH